MDYIFKLFFTKENTLNVKIHNIILKLKLKLVVNMNTKSDMIYYFSEKNSYFCK